MKLNRIVDGEMRPKIDMGLRKVKRNLSVVTGKLTTGVALRAFGICELGGPVSCSQFSE
jgi:hypothetical protein